MKFPKLVLVFLVTFSSCQFLTDKSKDSNTKDDGTRIIKSYYEKSGALKSEITVKDNKKNGSAKKYYPTGELHTLVNYTDGIKEGETVWYYKNGQPYRVTPYQKGKMHGIRKKYYENGALQAEIPYKYGELVEGTKEYKQNGAIVNHDVKIIFETLDLLRSENKFTLRIKLSEKSSKIEFYEEKTSTDGNKIRVPIKTNLSGTGKIEYYLPKGNSKISALKIFAIYESRLGNPLLISKSYNLTIKNKS
jgi:antitoxin component YwqK of YwqJK toxin-antitoxin module